MLLASFPESWVTRRKITPDTQSGLVDGSPHSNEFLALVIDFIRLFFISALTLEVRLVIQVNILIIKFLDEISFERLVFSF
ncbi:hypothetical protein D3272_23545 [Lichenibacterium ramalinae]|uniref:Uncharacterized protein n=1 Tax=Lichenibacterium ramalinae TaxID=2316527 RepID=A0A4Q2R8U9_9HYPH|nr:hypothetical protein D3272_23545 [Lichenibacterium ramalinae]